MLLVAPLAIVAILRQESNWKKLPRNIRDSRKSATRKELILRDAKRRCGPMMAPELRNEFFLPFVR